MGRDAVLALGLLVAVVGCGTSTGDGGVEPIDPMGTHYGFVLDGIVLAGNGAEANELGLDLDGDGRVDNQGGSLLATILQLFEQDIGTEIAERIGNGEVIQLVSIKTRSLLDAERVGFFPSLGEDVDGDAGDNWPGPETYAVSVGGAPGAGDIVDGVVTAHGGRLPLNLVVPFLADPVVLDLHAAAIDATIASDGMSGVLAGALHEDDIDAVLVPALHYALLEAIRDNCGDAPCPSGSFGARILDFFDADDDGVMTVDEVREHSVTQSLLQPDLDLFDSNGDFNPGVDQVPDSLSFGVGFTAVPAIFDAEAP